MLSIQIPVFQFMFEKQQFPMHFSQEPFPPELTYVTGVRYVITKFYRMDSLPNFLTHGAPLARFARESSAISDTGKSKL